MKRFAWFSMAVLAALCITLLPSLVRAEDPFKPDVVPVVVPVSTDAAFYADTPAVKLQAFRKVLVSQAEASCKAGEISRQDVFKLRLATVSPKALKQIHQACCEHVIADGKATTATAIDWSKLLEVIKELLPIILQLISLF